MKKTLLAVLVLASMAEAHAGGMKCVGVGNNAKVDITYGSLSGASNDQLTNEQVMSIKHKVSITNHGKTTTYSFMMDITAKDPVTGESGVMFGDGAETADYDHVFVASENSHGIHQGRLLVPGSQNIIVENLELNCMEK